MLRTRSAFSLALLVLLLARPAAAAEPRYEIRFPNPPGYVTLRCDLHQHTVFSDGLVWPTVRVAEAWRLGLDVIALSDHIEYQPHKQDVPTNFHRSFELAREQAKAHDILLIRAAEITRDTPPGHFNALFLNDIKALDTKDFLQAVRRANRQDAFVFWNHQEWKGPEKGQWLDVHTTLYNKEWLHGMEVCNGDDYYPSAHKWCLERNLTMLGNTDIHDPDLRRRSTSDDHRTMTLVFAKERTLPALKEALFEGRTAVWYKDRVIGRKEVLEPLFAGCVKILAPHQRGDKALWTRIENTCAADIVLQRTGTVGPAQLTLRAGAITLVQIDAANAALPLPLQYTATNFLIAPDTGLPVVLEVPSP